MINNNINIKVIEGKELFEALLLISFNAGLTPRQANYLTDYINRKFKFEITPEEMVEIYKIVLADNPKGELK